MKENSPFMGFCTEISTLADLLGVSRTTIYNHKKDKRWEINGYIIIKPDFVQIKSGRGGYRTKKEEESGGNDW